MKKQDYTTSFEIALSPSDVFTHVNNVSKWWAKTADEATSGWKTEFEGQSTKLNDEFIIRSGDSHYSKQKLIEFIPEKKVVWLVEESKLNWIKKNKDEWTNTKMVFELTPKGGRTILNFTHEGLVPEHECYSECVAGWNMFIKERLYNFMTNDFSYSLTVEASPKDAILKISQVNLWWAKKFKGKAEKLNDEFSVYFGDTYVDFKISEFVPDKKVVWLVTDCNLHWIKNKKEWKDTEVVWTFIEENGKTKIDFVHKGLTPENECYDSCKPGWTHHLQDSLLKLIDQGKGFPE